LSPPPSEDALVLNTLARQPTPADGKEVWSAFAEQRGAEIVAELRNRAGPLPAGEPMSLDMGRQIGIEFFASADPVWRWAVRLPTLTATADAFAKEFREWILSEPAQTHAAKLGIKPPVWFETRAECLARRASL
jgi:hypothetical protein